MVDTSKPAGVTMVKQVRIMISDLNYDFAACDPYLTKLELTMKDVLSAFKNTRAEMEACQQELFLLRERFEHKKLKCEKMERDYLLEKDSRIVCENRVYVNQRDVAREDNHRLNLLVEKLYGSKQTFENIDIIGNTYNWGWCRGEGLGKSNLSHLSPPTNEKINHSRVPEPEVIPQTSSDESSSAAADSDSSASK